MSNDRSSSSQEWDYEDLVRRLAPGIRATIREHFSWLLNEDFRDIVVFAVYRGCKTFCKDKGVSVERWIFLLLKQSIIEFGREIQRHRKQHRPHLIVRQKGSTRTTLIDHIPAPTPDVDDEIRPRLKDFLEVLDKLPIGDRYIMLMSTQDKETDDVAKKLRISPGYVRLKRARIKRSIVNQMSKRGWQIDLETQSSCD
jgi:RNA polymerase sigma factor (sigma-70 family)